MTTAQQDTPAAAPTARLTALPGNCKGLQSRSSSSSGSGFGFGGPNGAGALLTATLRALRAGHRHRPALGYGRPSRTWSASGRGHSWYAGRARPMRSGMAPM